MNIINLIKILIQFPLKVCGEEKRFEKLVGWFMSEEGFNLDFSVKIK